MNVTAKGQLKHHFWGDYRATIALVFTDEESATKALPVLHNGWTKSDKRGNALVWFGDGKKLRGKIKPQLVKFGADARAIESVAHSVDFGDPFEVSIPVGEAA